MYTLCFGTESSTEAGLVIGHTKLATVCTRACVNRHAHAKLPNWIYGNSLRQCQPPTYEPPTYACPYPPPPLMFQLDTCVGKSLSAHPTAYQPILLPAQRAQSTVCTCCVSVRVCVFAHACACLKKKNVYPRTPPLRLPFSAYCSPYSLRTALLPSAVK
jgi:hypothetical protein